MTRLWTAAASIPAAGLLATGFLALAPAASANASSVCTHCGPIAPTFHVRTVYDYHPRTVHLNRVVTRYAPRLHRIVNITRIQPVFDVHRITTIHHRTVFYRQDVNVRRVEYLPALTYVSSSSRSVYDCGCR